MYVSKDTTIKNAPKSEIKHFKKLMKLKKELDKAETEYWRRVPHEHKSVLIGTNGKIHPRQFKCVKCGTIEEYDNP